MTLNTVNIDKSGFQWRSNFVFSLNRNKVLSLDTESATIDKTFQVGSDKMTVTRTVVGKPIGQLYGYKVIGRFDKAEDFYYKDAEGNVKPVALPEGVTINKNGAWIGDYNFYDKNGDGVINTSDCDFIGNPQPDFTYGIGNTFSWKGFDLSIFFSGSYGNDVLNANRLFFESGWNKARELNQFASYADRWTEDNPYSDIPRATASSSNRVFSSRVIEDGSFLRLKTLTLGYTVPKKLLTRFRIDNLRVYFAAQNLWTLTNYSGYDPEVSIRNSALTPGLDFSAYPRARQFSFGVSLGF